MENHLQAFGKLALKIPFDPVSLLRGTSSTDKPTYGQNVCPVEFFASLFEREKLLKKSEYPFKEMGR